MGRWKVPGNSSQPRPTQAAGFASTTSQYGIKTLYEPKDLAVVDIVFVHGIRGHREKTWAADRGAGLWPQTLLPSKVSAARILTYGYDANVSDLRAIVSNNTIRNHAKNLLATLATLRELDNSATRPIVFVAHSMGGLVCQDTLLASKSSAEQHLRKIFEYTWGILFLGTPHSGTALASCAAALAKWIGLVKQTNHRIIEVLRIDSELLARIQDDFQCLLRSRPCEGYRQIAVTCFYEELPMRGVGAVVPQYSAIMPGYTAIGIHANHREMVRFSTSNDAGFMSVAGELQRWIKDIEYSTAIPINPFKEQCNENYESTSTINGTENRAGTVTIWGDVKDSSIVSGHQVVWGGITFR